MPNVHVNISLTYSLFLLSHFLGGYVLYAGIDV